MKTAMKLLGATFLVLLAACEEKKPETKPEDPSAKNAPTTQSAPAPAPLTIADGDLSTPADFEESAEQTITKANYKTELATLEADIGKE